MHNFESTFICFANTFNLHFLNKNFNLQMTKSLGEQVSHGRKIQPTPESKPMPDANDLILCRTHQNYHLDFGGQAL